MLNREELLKNYEKLNKEWLINAPYFSLDEGLFDDNGRYDLIRKIGYILYHSKNYESEIIKIVDNLSYKFARIWERSLVKSIKKSCHWKCEGFKSKESYKDYLEDEMYNIYGWNSDDAYKANVIKKKLNDISIITKEDYISDNYELCY